MEKGLKENIALSLKHALAGAMFFAGVTGLVPDMPAFPQFEASVAEAGCGSHSSCRRAIAAEIKRQNAIVATGKKWRFTSLRDCYRQEKIAERLAKTCQRLKRFGASYQICAKCERQRIQFDIRIRSACEKHDYISYHKKRMPYHK